MPAGLVPIVEISPPRAPIAPPIPTNRAVPFKSFPVSLAPSYIVCAIPQGAIISIPKAIKIYIFFILIKNIKLILTF